MYLIHVLLHTNTATVKKHFRFCVGKQGYLCLNSIGLATSIINSINMSWITEECTYLTHDYIHTKEYLCT